MLIHGNGMQFSVLKFDEVYDEAIRCVAAWWNPCREKGTSRTVPVSVDSILAWYFMSCTVI